MKIKHVCAMYFSPTNNSKMVVMTIAKKISEILGVELLDKSFTLPGDREEIYEFSQDTLLVIGSPTYAGKLPNKILPDFQNKILGHHTLVVPVVTYGNRAFDNSLAELSSILYKNGFITVAAATIVAEHAFSEVLAKGRPDESDINELKIFAQKIADKIIRDDISEVINIPGDANAPYYVPKGIDGKDAKFLKAKPVTNVDLCNNCGLCADKCPVGSILKENPSIVEGVCIKCQSCIKNCPAKAKYFDDTMFLSHVAMLQDNFIKRKENNYFVD